MVRGTRPGRVGWGCLSRTEKKKKKVEKDEEKLAQLYCVSRRAGPDLQAQGCLLHLLAMYQNRESWRRRVEYADDVSVRKERSAADKKQRSVRLSGKTADPSQVHVVDFRTLLCPSSPPVSLVACLFTN
ncbi:hypothetical protein PAPYR_5302 [Paratrimastix pyriformis]|uniref:Uncharacterized protein n=1 Tax=Paratrimastix pyriformis TaxID=342808 RepID=A0ABQ8UQ08_9EUKA|nr:hypothetical protein PAPYR_5302 [Paratrimastix pyriformis]